MHPRWTGGVVPPVAAAAAAPRLCLRIGGEDLRDDPVQIVKEGRPVPQGAATMIPNVNVVRIELVPLFKTSYKQTNSFFTSHNHCF